ncbi:hypothetical protein ACQY0O_007734 [Thecaphora frezii]
MSKPLALRLTLGLRTFTLPLALPFQQRAAPALALAYPQHPAQQLEAEGKEEDSGSLTRWWNGILNAVPKKKVSHSRKSMRSANKGLKDRVDLVHCPSCARPKLQHHLCAYCYSEINRRFKNTKDQPEATST